ncbi:MAG: UbiD family decarboxylase domain-containing protein [Acidimicrobiia bacterium]
MLDLHSFLDHHREEHLHIEKPVPLDHVGALVAEADETIVFDNLEGFPGWRLVDQLFVNRRAQARVLGCEPHEVVSELAEVLRRGPRSLKEVDGGPCQEEVVIGDDVDLATLPIVTHTDLDPYPYTTSFVVHKDPETGQYNQMFPRNGVLSRNEMVSSFVTSTANRILGKYQQAEEKMPQAVVIGCHPAWELAGCYSHPHDDWWELELFESITGSVGEVTRCRTLDLVVPADASLVIEGLVDPARRAQDGPSPGPTMLFTPYATQQPVFEVTAITRRKEPIYRHHQMTPFTDHQEMPRLFHEAIIYERLRAMGIGIRDVHFSQGGGSLCCLIQVEPRFDGQVTDALLSVMGSTWLNLKMVIAVDPDIDIYDYRDVQYALAVRVDPSEDVITVRNARGFPFDPTARPVIGAMPDTEDSRFPALVGKWGIDATKPVPYRKAERQDYERAWPLHWGEVSLEDYLS